jgi:hypothetical protein
MYKVGNTELGCSEYSMGETASDIFCGEGSLHHKAPPVRALPVIRFRLETVITCPGYASPPSPQIPLWVGWVEWSHWKFWLSFPPTHPKPWRRQQGPQPYEK